MHTVITVAMNSTRETRAQKRRASKSERQQNSETDWARHRFSDAGEPAENGGDRGEEGPPEGSIYRLTHEEPFDWFRPHVEPDGSRRVFTTD